MNIIPTLTHNPFPAPGTSHRAPRGRRDRPAAAEPVPRAPRGRKIAPRDRLSPLHIHTSGTFAQKGSRGESRPPKGGPPMQPCVLCATG